MQLLRSRQNLKTIAQMPTSPVLLYASQLKAFHLKFNIIAHGCYIFVFPFFHLDYTLFHNLSIFVFTFMAIHTIKYHYMTLFGKMHAHK